MPKKRPIAYKDFETLPYSTVARAMGGWVETPAKFKHLLRYGNYYSVWTLPTGQQAVWGNCFKSEITIYPAETFRLV